MTTMKNLFRALVLVAATAGAAALPAIAQADDVKAPAAAKAPPVSVDAKFDRWLISPRGEIHGMLLSDGAVIHAPAAAVKDTALHSGDAVHIDAHKKTFGAATIYGRALVKKNGNVVLDATGKFEKPEHTKMKLAAMSDTNTISAFIVGHHGKITGVVLADGTQAYAGHKSSLDGLGLKKGDSITVSGKGGAWALGRSLKIESVKLPDGTTKNL